MIFESKLVDMDQFVEDTKPGVIFTKEKLSDKWLVVNNPVSFEDPVSFSEVIKESQIHIPMFPYITAASGVILSGFMLQLGAYIMSQTDVNVKVFTTVFGSPLYCVRDLSENVDMSKLFIGIALRIV